MVSALPIGGSAAGLFCAPLFHRLDQLGQGAHYPMILPNLTIRLLGIQVGLPKHHGTLDAGALDGRLWTTGFFKTPITGPISVSRTNLEGDGQADLTHHGGPDKAVCCYSKDHWHYWESELDRDLPHGAFGENFTVGGCIEADVCIGDVFKCGTALFQVSQPRQPCWKLARRWRVGDLAARVEMTGRTGWYLRVLQEGIVEPLSVLALVERPFPDLTVSYANEVMHQLKDDWEAALHLSSCPLLSESWRRSLSARAREKAIADSDLRLKGKTD